MIRVLRRAVPSLSVALLLGGCAVTARSPTIDVLGSYFPAWIVCAVVGVALACIVRLVLIGLRLDGHVGPRAIFYPCLTLSFAFGLWLVFYHP